MTTGSQAIGVTVQQAHTVVLPDNIVVAPWSNWFSQWFGAIALPVDLPTAAQYELTLRFCDDPEIHALNRHYRQMDQPTDVLAFATLDGDVYHPLATETFELGDIIISVETAGRQAIAQQHALSYELCWLACHGFLHLLGWDHPTEAALKRMLQAQDRCLGAIGLSA